MFAVTNVDDIVVLALFFGQAHEQGRAGAIRVVIGQYLGFAAILARLDRRRARRRPAARIRDPVVVTHRDLGSTKKRAAKAQAADIGGFGPMPSFGRAVECEPDAGGGADDSAVSERHGQGDDRGFPQQNGPTGSIGQHRTVAPPDDHQVLELEDVSSKVGLTGPMVEGEGERAVVDPGEALALEKTGLQLGESGRWDRLNPRLEYIFGDCEDDDRSRQAFRSEGPGGHGRRTAARDHLGCSQGTAGDREFARRCRYAPAVAASGSDLSSQGRLGVEHANRNARSVSEIDAGGAT
ncbi:hypothetical protein [Kribbella orskensis]|nr:hypothetical protein [Kribbella orskensis]